MTKRQGKSGTIDVKALLSEDEEFLRALVRTALQEVLEAEMTEALGAERANGRRAGLQLRLVHTAGFARYAQGAGFRLCPRRARRSRVAAGRERPHCVRFGAGPPRARKALVSSSVPDTPLKRKGTSVTYQVPFRSEQPRQ